MADKATLALATLAGIGLLILVGLVAVGVVLRYVFARPIVGINEIVQMVSVAVVMLALPWSTSQGVHVRADVLDEAIGPYGRLLGDILSRALSIAVLAILTQRAWVKMLDTLAYGDASNMLGLPIWPVHALLALGVAVTIPILALQILSALADHFKVLK